MIETLGRLPECPMLEGCRYWSEVATEAVIDDEHRGNTYDYCPRCGTKCICSALRACEARTKSEARAIWIAMAVKNGVEMEAAGRADGYAAGIAAARDAVAALMPRFTQDNGWLMGQEIGAALDAALAAIDGVKGEQA